MLDFNRANFSERPLNVLLNTLIEKAEPPGKNYRLYLGASSIGAECLRKVQYDWMCDPQFSARVKDIFERGHCKPDEVCSRIEACCCNGADLESFARQQCSRWICVGKETAKFAVEAA